MVIDLKKDRKDLYQPSSDAFVEVLVPEMRYLAFDGHGDPNVAAEYPRAVEALFTTAYAIRAVVKNRGGIVFVVGPLEGLWSSLDPSTFVSGTKSEWDWTMLIPLPDEVHATDIEQGMDSARAKKPGAAVDSVYVLRLTEGRALQILHVGSYDDEAPVLASLHDELMLRLGVTWNGRHHEIYLSDPRRCAPDALRTVLRQPVKAL